jgi:predicted outer membrane protein
MKTLWILFCSLLLAAGCAQRASMGGGENSSESAAGKGSGARGITGGSGAVDLSREDAAFIREMLQSGMTEIKMGELAKENAQDQALKDLGQRLIDDHTRANDELARLAASYDQEFQAGDRAHARRGTQSVRPKMAAGFGRSSGNREEVDRELMAAEGRGTFPPIGGLWGKFGGPLGFSFSSAAFSSSNVSSSKSAACSSWSNLAQAITLSFHG